MDETEKDMELAVKSGKSIEELERLYPNEEKDYVNALPVLLMLVFLLGLIVFVISTCNPKFV